MKALHPNDSEFGRQVLNRKIRILLALLVMLFALLASSWFYYQHNRDKPTSTSRIDVIRQENQLPGTTAWQPKKEAPYDNKTFRSPAIEGYASTTSAIAGDIVSFAVSTNQPGFTADIYRLGWYQGKGGRLLQTVPGNKGHFYPMPTMDTQTGLAQAIWPVSFTIKIAPNWVTGMYLVQLTATNGMQSYIPFVVRSLQPTDFVFIHATATDQAYNPWGGKSLYDFNSTGGKRAYKVSFDRPLSGDGVGNLMNWEYPMIRWLEKNGYDMGYLSTEDIQANGNLLKNHHGILVVGHSEYWSKQMMDSLQSAINSGVSYANFAADTMSWQTRYEPSISNQDSVPNRILVCYKDKTLDPLYGKDDSQLTIGPKDAPLNRAPQSLVGAMYAGETTWSAGSAWVVADASSWVFNGTGLKNGDSLPGLVGYEYDKVYAGYTQAPQIDILASSQVHNISTNADDVSNATLYTAQSGAHVFDAGSIQWSWGVDEFNLSNGHKNVVSQAAQQITENILTEFQTNEY